MRVPVSAFTDQMIMFMAVPDNVGMRRAVMCVHDDMGVHVAMTVQKCVVNDHCRPREHNRQRANEYHRHLLFQNNKRKPRSDKRLYRVIRTRPCCAKTFCARM